jgi:hypothetical protein
MKIKNFEIINRINGLGQVAELPLPFWLTYAIRKNARKLEAEYKDYFESMTELNDKYQGDKESPEYTKELNGLLNIEVEIEFHMVPESTFDGADFDITLQQLTAIDFMIE